MATRKTTKKSTPKKTRKTAAPKKTRSGGRPKKITATEEIAAHVETEPAFDPSAVNAEGAEDRIFVGNFVPPPEEVEVPFNSTRSYETRASLNTNSYRLQEARREVSRAVRNQNAAYTAMITNTNPYQQEVLSLRFQVAVAEFDVAINNLETVLVNR